MFVAPILNLAVLPVGRNTDVTVRRKRIYTHPSQETNCRTQHDNDGIGRRVREPILAERVFIDVDGIEMPVLAKVTFVHVLKSHLRLCIVY